MALTARIIKRTDVSGRARCKLCGCTILKGEEAVRLKGYMVTAYIHSNRRDCTMRMTEPDEPDYRELYAPKGWDR